MGTTNAGAIGVTLSLDSAQYDSAMEKAAATAERSMQRTGRAQQAAQKSGDALVSSIQRQIDSFGLTGAALQRYEASLKGVSAQAEPLIQRLEKMRDAQAAFAAEAGKGMGGLPGSLDATGKAAGTASHGVAGITRELLVMGHEASQGNYKRLAGSFMVLAEFASGTIASLGLLIAPIVAVGAAVGGFIAALAIGAHETTVLNNALRLTGNAAGVTAGSVDAMSRSIAASTGQGIGRARTALEELIKTGEVGPTLIEPMGRAVVTLEKLTGESSETIVKDFAKMGDGVAKWAEEHNKQLNFITAAQYAYIRQLEETGQKEAAEAEVLRLLNEHLGSMKPTLGYLESAWKTLGEAASAAWDDMKGMGRAETIEGQLDKVTEKLNGARSRWADAGKALVMGGGVQGAIGALAGIGDPSKAELRDQQSSLQSDLILQRRAARLDAVTASTQRAGIASVAYFAKMQEEAKGASQLDKDLATLDANIKARVAAGGPAHTAEDATIEAYYRHKDRSIGDKSAEKLDTRYKDRLEALTAEGIKLDFEAKNFEKYGKAINDSRLAIVNLEVAQGKLQGLSPQKIQNLQAQAKLDDEKAKTLADTEAKVRGTAAAEKFIAKLEEESNAHAMNARETAVAADMARLDADVVEKGGLAYDIYAERIKRAVAARYDQLLVNKLAAEQLAADDEVHKLDEQVAALGQSTLARQNATIALRFYNEAQKELAANPDNAAEILAAQAKKTDEVTAANVRLYNAQRTSQTGADTFFHKYQEEATNAAKVTESLASKGVGDLENALTSLLSGQKVEWHQMVDSLVAEIIRLQIIKPMLADIFGSTGTNGTASQGWGAVLGSVLKVFGGGGGGGSIGAGTVGGSNVSDAGVALANYAVGTNYVPQDGPAYLHKGEAVVPVAHNKGSRGAGALHVYVQPPPNMDRGTAMQHGRDIGAGIRGALARND